MSVQFRVPLSAAAEEAIGELASWAAQFVCSSFGEACPGLARLSSSAPRPAASAAPIRWKMSRAWYQHRSPTPPTQDHQKIEARVPDAYLKADITSSAALEARSR